MKENKTPTIFQSLAPIIVLMILIAVNVFLMPDDTLSGANQLSLLVASGVAVGIAMYNGIKWKVIENKLVQTISTATSSIIILLTIGLLSGTWMLSGVVPTMIYYGLKIISSDYFLPTTIVLSAIVSLVTGSSWSTIATIGVALLGIGRALGFSDGLIAGAIISGAYFGDKVSPLSDTTNLAAAVAKVPIFDHIRFLMKTTIPTFIVSIIIFAVISILYNPDGGSASGADMEQVLGSLFNISPLLLLVPLAVVVLIAKKVPTVIVLFFGGMLGGIVALIAQPQIVTLLSGESALSAKGAYEVITKAMFTSTTIPSGNATMDDLLTTNGMAGMLNTIWLIMTAMIFGGALEAGKLLERLVQAVESRVLSPGMAVTATAGTCMMFNVTSGDQYMAIVIPGNMFASLYERLKLPRELLSRSLEDSGTVTSVLIPWNTCGAAQSATLGVATLAYAPFAFFCYLTPITTILFAWLRYKITPKKNNDINTEKIN